MWSAVMSCVLAGVINELIFVFVWELGMLVNKRDIDEREEKIFSNVLL